MEALTLTFDTWLRSVSRVLFTGLPLYGKSEGCRTLPHRLRDGPQTAVLGKPVTGDLHYIVVPGEQGFSTVLPSESVHVHAWKWSEKSDLAERKEVYAAFIETVRAAITGKLGDVHSLVIDGLSWWYPLVMPLFGWSDADFSDKESGKKYGRFHVEFQRFLNPILGSAIPVVAGTAYLDREPSDPENPKSFKVGLPSFPGRMGRQDIFGMFPLIIACEREAGPKGDRFYWRLRPSNQVRSAGMHVPRAIAEAFPAEVPPDWREIERIIGKVLGEGASSPQGGGLR